MSERQDHNGKSSLKRKQYEKELRRLQELCRLQELGKYKGLRVIVVFEDGTAQEKGTIPRHQGACQPTRVPTGRVTRTIRSRKESDVYSALYSALPRSRRGGHL